jgi:hypothetical protein
MNVQKLLHWKLIVPVCCVAVFLFADRARLIRVDSISAMTCTRELFSDTEDPFAIVARYRQAIALEAAEHDLPPELLSAIIINHQAFLPRRKRYTDCVGSALGRNVSLGLAQVRLSTAVLSDGRRYADLPAADFRLYRSRLLNPVSNIRYQAKELRSLLERKNRFPGTTADELIHQPSVMALLITEYRMGRLKTPVDDSRLSAAAFAALRYFLQDALFMFDRKQSDIQSIQAQIETYLDYIYCESGIFNERACENWMTREH